MGKYKEYAGDLDRKFFTAMDIKVVQYQPWQFGLFHPDLEGKFVWYPRKGTLMFENDDGIYKVCETLDNEEVVDEINKKITEQQDE